MNQAINAMPMCESTLESCLLIGCMFCVALGREDCTSIVMCGTHVFAWRISEDFVKYLLLSSTVSCRGKSNHKTTSFARASAPCWVSRCVVAIFVLLCRILPTYRMERRMCFLSRLTHDVWLVVCLFHQGLFVCLFICLFVCLFLCLFVCLFA